MPPQQAPKSKEKTREYVVTRGSVHRWTDDVPEAERRGVPPALEIGSIIRLTKAGALALHNKVKLRQIHEAERSLEEEKKGEGDLEKKAAEA